MAGPSLASVDADGGDGSGTGAALPPGNSLPVNSVSGGAPEADVAVVEVGPVAAVGDGAADCGADAACGDTMSPDAPGVDVGAEAKFDASGKYGEPPVDDGWYGKKQH